MLEEINNRLRLGRVGVKVEQRGDRLYLVATLPPKPNTDKTKPHQQRIALGIRANPAGLKQAELEAKKLGVQLAEGTFAWEVNAPDQTVRTVIAKFEKDYFAERGKTPKTQTTYSSNYAQLFKKLPLDDLLDSDLLIKVIKSTKPNTRNRQLICRAFKQLAQSVGIELNTSKLQGDYGLKRVNPRVLPTDREIENCLDLLKNGGHRWIYGMMAVFGLRPHEVFLIDTETLVNDGICHVLDGKTGERKVWPLYPHWLDFFDLKNIRMPEYKVKNHRDYGSRVSKFFRDNKIPFHPYALRHSWARRAIELGLDSQLAAKQMGHSHNVHTTIYGKWIDDAVHQRAYEQIVNNPDRIKPV